MRPLMSRNDSIRYTGGDLDRADALRKDPEWIAARLAEPATRFVLMWRDRNFATPYVDRPVDAATEQVFLGLRDGAAVFASDLSQLDEADALAAVGDGSFRDLRELAATLEARDASVLAYARGMLHWHRNHRFCGRCGSPTGSRRGGHMRVCLDPDCGREHFPLISPAVIMLVSRRGDDGTRYCLLGRHARLPRGVWSTLAGFVELGESFEETVAREVFEESGIRVAQSRYVASQPWPFPASLMVAFRAEASSSEITIDAEELEEARWFTADEVRRFGDWYDESAEYRLPRRDSIARFLVDSWLTEQ
ncbi:MAG: hydrolase [Acidobacteria bacterium]|nr:hydrolase [Acidobacteriota bacterium]